MYLINEMHSFDVNICFILSKLLNGSITDLAQRQASLPFRLGDTGVRCFHFTLYMYKYMYTCADTCIHVHYTCTCML